VTVSYLLRLPAGDFLEKRTVADGQERVLKVEKEQCDVKLGVCVPLLLVERQGVVTLGTTMVGGVVLNAELPQERFSPKRPSGW
jgi:hypothetical protein